MTTGGFSKRSLWGWAALALLNCTVVIPWLSSLAPLHPRDFEAFYLAAQIYRDNPGHILYDQGLQFSVEQQTFAIDDGHAAKYFLPFNHLPYELVLWLPLTALPVHLAFWLWRIESLGLLAVTSLLIALTLGQRSKAFLVFLMLLAFFPVPSSLMSGQDTPVTLALLALCLWLLKTNRRIYAGMVLALGLFKLQLVLPAVGVFFLCGWWQVVAGFALSGAFLVAVSTAMVGLGGMKSLLRLWLAGESGALYCIRPGFMPNIRGLLADFSGMPPRLVTIATMVISFGLLLLVAQQAKRLHSVERLFALSMCFVALVSFHTNVYDLSILIFPILLILGAVPEMSTHSRRRGVTPVFLLFFTPTYILAAAAVKIGLLAIVVGWLWYAVSYGLDGLEAEDREALSRAPAGAAVL